MNELHDIVAASSSPDAASHWSFFTNHFLVLACVANEPDLRVRDIAAQVGITERATQAILSDLAAAGYLERIRIGRRNRYEVHRESRFRHRLVSRLSVGQVLDLVLSSGRRAAAS